MSEDTTKQLEQLMEEYN